MTCGLTALTGRLARVRSMGPLAPLDGVQRSGVLSLLSCGLQRLPHGIRIASYHHEVGARSLIRFDASLFPIAEGADRNAELLGERFLGEPKRLPDDLCVRSLHAA